MRPDPTDAAPIRVAVVYRVCQHWRAPMFARLNRQAGLDVTVFHGRDVPGTKLINASTFEGFGHRQMFTLSGHARSSGRRSPWIVCPFVGFSLLRFRPQVIVLEGGSNVFTNMFVYPYAWLFRKPIVWWTLGELPGRRFSGLGRLYKRVVITMERMSRVLLGYSSVALAYFSRMGYPREKCFRAVNCVDTERVLADIERGRERVPQLREHLGLTGRRVVLFVGALTAPKKIDRLLRAFDRARHEIDDAHLLIVGDGAERAALEQLADEIGLAGQVTFAGQVVDDVADYFQLGHVFVMPGLGGLAVSEAMTHGLPVICSRGDGCEVDLVRQGATGFRFDSDDDEQVIAFLAEKMVATIADDEARAAMSTAARQVIMNEHNVGSYIEHVADAIRCAYTGRRSTPLPEILT